MKNIEYNRGDVLVVAFSPVIGSEQSDVRPAIVVSNELFHRLNIVTVIAVTSKNKAFPGRVTIFPDEGNGLRETSDALAFQMRTISTRPERILKRIGRLSQKDLRKIDEALKITLHL